MKMIIVMKMIYVITNGNNNTGCDFGDDLLWW